MKFSLLQSIRNKIIAALIVAGALSALLVGELANWMSKAPTIEAASASLADANHIRALSLSAYSESVDRDLNFFTEIPSTGRDIANLTTVFERVNTAAGSNVIRDAFVDNNPYELAQRGELFEAEAAGQYSSAHADVHALYHEFMEAVGFYDVFLISKDGTIVYSVVKEADFGTNLVDGPYKDTGLAKVFKAATKLKKGEVVFDDLAPYAPSNNVPAGFVGMPVYSKNPFKSSPEFVGVLAVQISVDKISTSVFSSTQLGGGLSYIVGPDNILRSIVPTIEDATPGVTPIDLQEEVEGNYRVALGGTPSIIATAEVDFLGSDWRIVSELPAEFAEETLVTMGRNLLVISVPVLLVLSALSVWMGRSLSQPIIGLGNAVSNMAQGQRSEKVPFGERTDEVGAMATNLERFRVALNDADDERKRTVEREEQLAQERAKMLEDLEQGVGGVVAGVTSGDLDARVNRTFDDAVINRLAQGVNRICELVGRFLADFETAVDGLARKDLTVRVGKDYDGRFQDVATNFNAAIESLTGTVQEITGSTAEMTESVRGVETGASELASRAVSQASSLEETAASMEQIAQSVSDTAENARKASALAAETENWASKGREVVGSAVTAMAEIEGSSAKIADIISIIDSIAFQTNLLALNAAVEAARAGDAGKGFAVVASEVRTLAQRSSEAAKDIGDLISASSSQVSDGVRLVNATGDSLRDISTAIAGFGETIAAISGAMDEQQLSTAEVSAAISEMDTLTQQNAGMADSSASAVQVITSLSDKLAARMVEFRVSQNSSNVRAIAGPVASTTAPVSKSATGKGASEDDADKAWVTLEKSTVSTPQPPKIAVGGPEGEWAEF